MQSLHKNENLLFKDFQDFLLRSQHLPEKRIPFYLLWVSRFHEFCSRQHLDGMGKEAVASYLQDLAKDHERFIMFLCFLGSSLVGYWLTHFVNLSH